MSDQQKPLKITDTRSEDNGDGLVVYDPQQQRAFVLNATSSVVWQHCDGVSTTQDIASQLAQRFRLHPNQANKLLWLSLEELQRNQLLQAIATPAPAMSRRQFLAAFSAIGLALVLMPVVSPLEEIQAASTPCPKARGNATGTDADVNKATQQAKDSARIQCGPCDAVLSNPPSGTGRPRKDGKYYVTYSFTCQPKPTSTPTKTPTKTPTSTPTKTPTSTPTKTPTSAPTKTPTSAPTKTPTSTPTKTPTSTPTKTPTSTQPPYTTTPPPYTTWYSWTTSGDGWTTTHY